MHERQINDGGRSGPGMVPASYVQIIVQTLSLSENEMERLLHGSGARIQTIKAGQETQLSSQDQMTILKNALVISGDKGFGLELGRKLSPDTHGPMGFLVLSSRDVLTAIRAFADFLPLRFPFSAVHLEQTEQGLMCTLILKLDVEAPVKRLLQECFALMIQSVIETMVGRNVNECLIELQHAEPSYSARYSEFLHSPVSFSADENRVHVPGHVMSQPNINSHHRAFALAQDICIDLLNALPKEDVSTTARVKRILLTGPPGMQSIEQIAQTLFMSPRTLQRRLRAEHSGFRGILDEIHADLATRHLQDADMTVEAVACLLGYNDAAAFRKAFRRWFGVSPSDYRGNR